VLASSNVTPCFVTFEAAFSPSHSNFTGMRRVPKGQLRHGRRRFSRRTVPLKRGLLDVVSSHLWTATLQPSTHAADRRKWNCSRHLCDCHARFRAIAFLRLGRSGLGREAIDGTQGRPDRRGSEGPPTSWSFRHPCGQAVAGPCECSSQWLVGAWRGSGGTRGSSPVSSSPPRVPPTGIGNLLLSGA
jgi:hypothetical protein